MLWPTAGLQSRRHLRVEERLHTLRRGRDAPLEPMRVPIHHRRARVAHLTLSLARVDPRCGKYRRECVPSLVRRDRLEKRRLVPVPALARRRLRSARVRRLPSRESARADRGSHHRLVGVHAKHETVAATRKQPVGDQVWAKLSNQHHIADGRKGLPSVLLAFLVVPRPPHANDVRLQVNIGPPQSTQLPHPQALRDDYRWPSRLCGETAEALRNDAALSSAPDTVLSMDALSLFSGAGGLDIGVERAGFRTVAVVESAPTACATLLANRRYLPALNADRVLNDVTGLSPEALLERAGLKKGEAALMVGGPPCTPFSKSGNWLEYKRAGKDPKASLLDEYVRLLHGTRPKAFVMENVYGLAYRNQNRDVFTRFQRGVQDAGYAFDHRVLLAADYGVPQLRQRLLCVGFRRDILDVPEAFWRFAWPQPTHSGPHETRKGWDGSLQRHVSVGASLAGIEVNPPEPEEFVKGTYADELRAVPPGDNYLFLTDKRGHPDPQFEWRSRYWSFLLKLHPDRPSPTIQGQPGPWVGPFHWDSRRLRVAELKRLMTFPDDFRVLGNRREQQLQLGNAVPPMLGQVLALAVARELTRLGAIRELPVAA